MNGESKKHESQFGDTTLTKVFVAGLAWETQRETMRRYFEQFGEILEAVVITDKNTRCSKGYGFVTFRDPLVTLAPPPLMRRSSQAEQPSTTASTADNPFCAAFQAALTASRNGQFNKHLHLEKRPEKVLSKAKIRAPQMDGGGPLKKPCLQSSGSPQGVQDCIRFRSMFRPCAPPTHTITFLQEVGFSSLLLLPHFPEFYIFHDGNDAYVANVWQDNIEDDDDDDYSHLLLKIVATWQC
eukprot:Gb_39058 [translate_table: standard]